MARLRLSLWLWIVAALMALGLSVIYGVIRIVNFAHGELMALGGHYAQLFEMQSQGAWLEEKRA